MYTNDALSSKPIETTRASACIHVVNTTISYRNILDLQIQVCTWPRRTMKRDSDMPAMDSNNCKSNKRRIRVKWYSTRMCMCIADNCESKIDEMRTVIRYAIEIRIESKPKPAQASQGYTSTKRNMAKKRNGRGMYVCMYVRMLQHNMDLESQASPLTQY